MNRESTPTNARSPMMVLTIVLVMTWALLAGLSWLSYSSYHNAQATTQRRVRIEELRGVIIHLDEVLTMSARTAAFTGDLRWENRYRRFEPQLDAAIKESRKLAPEAFSREMAAETDAANIKLVEMENQAFDLVRRGRLDEARAALFSDEYETLKRVYAQGMTRFARPKERHLRLAELRGIIVHLDEVLTMSARFAAATGDLQWENRYRRFEPQLDAAVKEAIALAPVVHTGQAAAETDAANIKLVEMENQAFDLVRQGRLDEAKAVLFSDEYDSQKQVFAKGMDAFAAGLADAVSTALKREQRLASLQTGAVLLILSLLIIGWLVVFRAVQNWKTILAKQADDVAEVNQSLDQKIAERTEALRHEAAERMRAEESVRKSEASLRSVLDTIPDYVLSLDREGKILFINRNLPSRTPEQVVGTSAFEYLPPDHRHLLQEGLEAVFQTGEVQTVEHILAAEQTGAETWLASRIGPVRRGCEIVGATIVSVDVTQWRQAEQLSRVLFETSRDAIMTLAPPSWKFTSGNPSTVKMFVVKNEAEFISFSPWELSPEKQPDGRRSADKAKEMIATAMRDGSHFFEWTHKRLGGDDFPATVLLTRVNLLGQVFLQATVRDITRSKQMEAERNELHEKLVETSRLAGMAELATCVLHNVGNVLNSVNVSAQLAIEKVKNSHITDLAVISDQIDQHSEDLGTFIISDERGKHLPRFVRDLSRQLLGERDSVLEELALVMQNVEHINEIVGMQQAYATTMCVTMPVSLTDLVEDVLKMHEASFLKYHVELVREYEELPQVMTDKHKVLQILRNLINNAKQALTASDTDEKRLTVRVVRSGEDHVTVEMKDNGVGISSKNLNRVFQYGFTTKRDGHGFGLHSSALAADDLDGSLTAHSDGPGRGATFSLTLPIEAGVFAASVHEGL